jgi:hypothetical protein
MVINVVGALPRSRAAHAWDADSADPGICAHQSATDPSPWK